MIFSSQPRISVSKHEILDFLGQPQSSRLIQLANEVNGEAQAFLSPIYHISDSIQRSISKRKRGISNPENERYFVGAATIGAKLEQEVSRLFKSGLFSQGLTLDAFGTIATRKTVQEALKTIKDMAADDRLFPGKIIMPGIDGESLELHEIILQAFGSQQDILVTEKLLLRPLKSSTFYISLSHNSNEYHDTCFSQNCSRFNPKCNKCYEQVQRDRPCDQA
ncbi:MAG: hypothetical protein ACE5OZ_10215 [Candidatus Heimdallarchaeota archaeon]